jgi:uncharacterized protein (DUF58 family)
MFIAARLRYALTERLSFNQLDLVVDCSGSDIEEFEENSADVAFVSLIWLTQKEVGAVLCRARGPARFPPVGGSSNRITKRRRRAQRRRRPQSENGGFPRIVLKNSNFGVDHNSEGHRQAS